MDFLPLLEAIGFDFALIGALALTPLVLSVLLVRRLDETPWQAVSLGVKPFVPIARKATAPTLLALALAMAIAGMIGNAASDWFFDNTWMFSDRKDPGGQFAVKTCEKVTAGAWRSEDALKQDSVKEVCERTAEGSPARAYLREQADFEGALQLVQLASAALLAPTASQANAAMRLEYMVVKVFRVLVLGALLVAFASVIRLLLVIGLAVRRLERRRAPAPWLPLVRAATHLGLQAVIVMLMATIASISFLRLWGTQSERYYKKLTYFLLDSLKLDASGVNHPSVGTYSLFESVPGFVVRSETRNTQDSDGSTSGFEFSGLVSIGQRTLVVDNETRSVRIDSPRNAPQAFFEAAFAISPPALSLTRPHRGDLSTRRSIPYGGSGAAPDWDDLEAVTTDGANWVYAVGSHSLSSSGFLRPERQVILRWPIAALERAGYAPATHQGLMAAFLGIEHGKALGLEPSVAAPAIDTPGVGVVKDLAIEGLAAVPSQGLPNASSHDLLLGLRAPLRPAASGEARQAMVFRLANPSAMFASGSRATPQLSLYASLDLDGGGIADLFYDEPSHAFLVAASPRDERDNKDYSSLWLWKPEQIGNPKELMRFRGHKLEGISRIDRAHLMLAFDEEQWRVDGEGLAQEQFGELVVLANQGF